jgi:hypothetical protein
LALWQYVSFYRNIVPVLSDVVVSPFQRTIRQFQTVVADLNLRFDMNLAPYEASEASERRVRRAVELMEMQDGDGRSVRENAVARPSAIRNAARGEIYQSVRKHQRLLRHAEAIHERVVSECRIGPLAYEVTSRS